MNSGRKRKGRHDRTHVIYQLTVDKKTYVGMTYVRKGSVNKTMRTRILQHWYNAHVLKYKWELSEAIRECECVEDIEYIILAKVRGKEAAHKQERNLIIKQKPSLNTDIRIAKRK